MKEGGSEGLDAKTEEMENFHNNYYYYYNTQEVLLSTSRVEHFVVYCRFLANYMDMDGVDLASPRFLSRNLSNAR